MRRILRLDPLLLFLVLGAGLAALHLWTRSPEVEASSRRIVVTDADVLWIAQGFQARRMRPPTQEELDGLVRRHVRSELLFREAVALGLDREDPDLRRRLALKLEYLAQDRGAAAEPTEAELRSWMQEHADRYATPPRRRFEQVFLNEDRREDAEADATALLETLRRSPDTDLTELGDPLLLDVAGQMSTPAEVARLFGPAFSESLFRLAPDTWEGPVPSGYGLHLLRVTDTRPAGPPALGEVGARVRNDLLRQRKEDALGAYLDTLHEKYEVEIRSALLTPEDPAR